MDLISSFFSDIDEIIPRLYIGNIYVAEDVNRLREYGISHVCQVTLESVKNEDFKNEFTYKVVQIGDHPNVRIHVHFEECIRFIENALKDGESKILVHCSAGASRSATIVIAYLMYKFGLDYLAALKLVKSKRNVVHPNDGFMKQLKEFQPDLLGDL